MKVKMREVYQGTNVEAVHSIDGIKASILEIGEEYVVGDALGKWLIENGKAEEIKPVELPKVDGNLEEKSVEEKPVFQKRRK